MVAMRIAPNLLMTEGTADSVSAPPIERNVLLTIEVYSPDLPNVQCFRSGPHLLKQNEIFLLEICQHPWLLSVGETDADSPESFVDLHEFR